MERPTTPFWRHYRHLVARLLSPLMDGDGCPEVEVAEAEARLGRPLPRLLREFYLAAGGREDLNHAFEHLLAPAEVRLAGEVLVFYEEAQSVFLWGAALDEPAPDPKVLRAHHEPEPSWEPHQGRLSGFLIEMLLVQAVNGGMPYGGIGSIPWSILSALDQGWETVAAGGAWDLHWLLREGQLIHLGAPDGPFSTEQTCSIIAAGRTAEDLSAIKRDLKLTWTGVFITAED